jgi:hypothetical protein
MLSCVMRWGRTNQIHRKSAADGRLARTHLSRPRSAPIPQLDGGHWPDRVHAWRKQKRNTVPLYSARVEHLIHAPAVGVTCRCGHLSTVSVAFIRKRIDGATMLKNLHHHMRWGVRQTRTV